jgi:hypothetical protein
MPPMVDEPGLPDSRAEAHLGMNPLTSRAATRYTVGQPWQYLI